jgi:hypothetical protein
MQKRQLGKSNLEVSATIGSSTFTVRLDDNPRVDALKAMLPLAVEMTELNGNEKYVDLPTKLPVALQNPARSRPAISCFGSPIPWFSSIRASGHPIATHGLDE